MKEEQQRQQEEEAQKVAEAEKAWKEVEAKMAWREVEAEEVCRKVKAKEAWKNTKEGKQAWKEAERVQAELEQLLQCKVAARITQEQKAQRVSEAGGGASGSGILGYGKGKAPEKRVCTNCLRKGIECEWDKGGWCFGTQAKTVVFKAKTLQPWQTMRVERSYENIKPCCSTTPEII